MHGYLILSTREHLASVQSALDAADPLGSPWRLPRLASREDDEIPHWFAGFLASPDAHLAQRIVNGLRDSAGVLVIVENGTAEQALAGLGAGYRFRPGPPDNLASYTVTQLRALADARGVDHSGLTLKSAIIAAIEADRGVWP